jgi:hypothetical protein
MAQTIFSPYETHGSDSVRCTNAANHSIRRKPNTVGTVGSSSSQMTRSNTISTTILGLAREYRLDAGVPSRQLPPFGYAFSSIRRSPGLPCSRICLERLNLSRSLWTSFRIAFSPFSARLCPCIEHRRNLLGLHGPGSYALRPTRRYL